MKIPDSTRLRRIALPGLLLAAGLVHAGGHPQSNLVTLYEVAHLAPPAGVVSRGNVINERGWVAGFYDPGDDTRRAVLWDDGEPIDLGNIGSMTWNTPMAIIERSEVVGFANIADMAGGGFNAHAFYWNPHDGIRSLGVLEGNNFSQAHSINARGQAVGISFGGSAGNRAFLWEGNELIDLNTRVVPGYTGVLLDARYINDRGVITGSALAHTGEVVPFVATPVQRGGTF